MTSTAQTYQELQQGVAYESLSKIQVSSVGIKLRVPDGWSGALPQGSDYFVMDNNDVAASCFLLVDQWDESQVRLLMSQYIPLDEFSGLNPTGELSENDGLLICDYTVASQSINSNAFVVGKIGDHGFSVAVVLLAASELIDTLKKSMIDLMNSVEFSPPATTPANPAGAEISDWEAYMKGRYIVYMKTESGYSEEEKIWLCSDGSFARYHSDSYLSGGFSYAGQVPERYGKWGVSGNTLELNFEDGTQGTYSLEIYEDSLYLNGRKWFRDTNERCQ